MFKRYSSAELHVENVIKPTNRKVASVVTSGNFKFSAKPGMLYVTTRAISARVNRNFDGFPSSELKKAAGTFENRPVFVNHNNTDHTKTKGMILGSKYIENGDDKYIELLIEVDAVHFPMLAAAISSGDVDSVSMGTNCEFTVCSACDNVAYDWREFCDHIPAMKGRTAFVEATGESVLIYESCYGLNFFEISFVFDPADETALFTNVVTAGVKTAEWTRDNLPNVGSEFTDEKGREWVVIEVPTNPIREYEEPDTLYPGGANQGYVFCQPKDGGRRKSFYPGFSRGNRASYGHLGPVTFTKVTSVKQAHVEKQAYGETVAPADVDTLRQEEPCAQCGQLTEEGVACPICGYEAPIQGLGDPDTSIAKDVDLRQESGDQEVEIDENGLDPNQDTDLGNEESPEGSVDKSELGNRVQNMDEGGKASQDDSDNDEKSDEDDSDEDDDDKKKDKKLHSALELRKIARAIKQAEESDPEQPEQPGEPEQPDTDVEFDGNSEQKVAYVDDLVLVSYKLGARWVGEVVDEQGVILSKFFKNDSDAQRFVTAFAKDVVKLAAAAPKYEIGDKAEYFTLDQPGAPWIWKPVTVVSVNPMGDKGHQSVGFIYDNEFAKNEQPAPGSVVIGPRGGGKEFRLR